MCPSSVFRNLANLGYYKKQPIVIPILTRLHKHICIVTLWNIGIRVNGQFVTFQGTGQESTPEGGVCNRGKTILYCFRENMTRQFYSEILKHLLEIKRMLRNNCRLHQDNDPKHTSRVAKKIPAADSDEEYLVKLSWEYCWDLMWGHSQNAY
ncbi:3574_t:CDS:2 [Funneliformis mosseae]|uniref:3574_t:CDS:1 n=1 Tax=Funneliformis mosseae TaxID=27381 RepID=A0A9N8VU97_FUNMO|nr:3574_t:CDS:2 [Funneliformis mosseae]